MRLAVAFGFALLLAGCGRHAEQTGAANGLEDGQLPTNDSAPPPASTSVSASAAQNSAGALPPADAAMRFVGTWARSKEQCATKPWRFTAHELSAADGPNCSFYKISKTAAGYDLAAQCPNKKPVPTDLIRLRFAESARAMLVESNAIAPVGLVYCGELPR